MLFESTQLGELTLANRIVMAPMTRCRAGQPGNVPTALNAEYYVQRASAGLIITEGSQVSPQGVGYLWTPGIHSEEQVAGWKQVTTGVQEAGGHIFIQLWHCGRISHNTLQPEGAAPVAPTARPADAMAFGYDEAGQPGYLACSTPQALDEVGISAIVAEFRRASENALAAGFDGAEIHGANGYLFDQFLNGALNDRDDEYGGSMENRARLLLQVVDQVSEVLGAGRVGVRLSPHGSFNDMPPDREADDMVDYLAQQLGQRGIAYLHFVDPVINGDPGGAELMKIAREVFGGPVIACGAMDRTKAEAYLNQGQADLIGFGQAFIANPDLPARLRQGAALAEADPDFFYGGGAEGYTDYPAMG